MSAPGRKVQSFTGEVMTHCYDDMDRHLLRQQDLVKATAFSSCGGLFSHCADILQERVNRIRTRHTSKFSKQGNDTRSLSCRCGVTEQNCSFNLLAQFSARLPPRALRKKPAIK